VHPAPAFRVMVGKFETIEIKGYIPSLDMSIQGHNMHIPDVYLLHVVGGDLILGTSWLKTLKAHIVDYDTSFIHFLHEGKFITLLGDKSNLPQPAQFHHIKRFLHLDAIDAAFTVEMNPKQDPIPQNFTLPANLHLELALLLQQYVPAFAILWVYH